MNRYDVIDDSEIADIRQAMTELGYEPKDFELQEKQDPYPSFDPYPATGKVTITRKKTGISKIYEGGHNSTWPAQFALGFGLRKSIN